MEGSCRGLRSVREGAQEGNEGVLEVSDVMDGTSWIIRVAVIICIRSNSQRV